MEFDHSFDVPLPPPQAWSVLMDVARIAPCMPGAHLTEIVDPRTFKGKVAVRLGPVALSFAGTARLEAVDETAHIARIKAGGTDSKGRGGANAIASFRLEPTVGGSTVLVHTDLTLSGTVAQYGRATGMIQDVAGQIIQQFATSLKALIAAEEPVAPAVVVTEAVQPDVATVPAVALPPPAKPLSGLSLMARAMWNSLLRRFGRQPRAT